MKIDLHVHTREHSFCGRSTAEEQVRAAVEAGLDALVFTNHNRLVPQPRLEDLNEKYAPFQVFGGIEVDINDEHILVIGIHDTALESRRWSYPDLHRFVLETNGFLALAHPFRFTPTISVALEQFPPDAVEAYSNNISPRTEQRIHHLARQLDVPVLSNSDAHHRTELGKYYNQFQPMASEERDVIDHLKTGPFTPVFPA
ncbi:hypothetical protein GF339_22380 [candidate division KSB3 bacterium]|uniref:Polymerase/histidinol phosphatase N-terminal domain-containing protein n=1 Tax=candidate division KSB3 bacterium TaxID=2044937 RepID=A0A9D5K0E7_9BACT|nr:hypothetical protein [candidate division KSB3 bacterium]MBD3327350.1 hypothetical protein [candidate division KSB3 bacterium]